MQNSFRALATLGVTTLATGLSSVLGAPAWDKPDPSGPAGGGTSFGSATAEVRHVFTGQPLAGMPVHVVRIVPPEGDAGGVRIFTTGRDGRALLSPLESGSYECYVEYNNHRSRSAFFEINADTDFHPFVTLLFNPDID